MLGYKLTICACLFRIRAYNSDLEASHLCSVVNNKLSTHQNACDNTGSAGMRS